MCLLFNIFILLSIGLYQIASNTSSIYIFTLFHWHLNSLHIMSRWKSLGIWLNTSTYKVLLCTIKWRYLNNLEKSISRLFIFTTITLGVFYDHESCNDAFIPYYLVLKYCPTSSLWFLLYLHRVGILLLLFQKLMYNLFVGWYIYVMFNEIKLNFKNYAYYSV